VLTPELIAGYLGVIALLIVLEGVLSIDNAALLGAMVRHLPSDQRIPWPTWLNLAGGRIDRWLGYQRDAALKVGLLGAYIGRGSMLFFATLIADNEWIRGLGAAYLVWLAIEHFGKLRSEHETEEHAIRKAGFWGTVWAVELADLAFSIDNVVAAVALSDQLWVILVGVAIGIVTMRFAASYFGRLISWEPWLRHGAYVLLILIGGELLIEQLTHFHVGEALQAGLSFGTLGMTVLTARTEPLRKLVLALGKPFTFVCHVIVMVVEPVMKGFVWVVTRIWAVLAGVFTLRAFRKERSDAAPEGSVDEGRESAGTVD
jgi:tellurite resistance protein TerC